MVHVIRLLRSSVDLFKRALGEIVRYETIVGAFESCQRVKKSV